MIFKVNDKVKLKLGVLATGQYTSSITENIYFSQGTVIYIHSQDYIVKWQNLNNEIKGYSKIPFTQQVKEEHLEFFIDGLVDKNDTQDALKIINL